MIEGLGTAPKDHINIKGSCSLVLWFKKRGLLEILVVRILFCLHGLLKLVFAISSAYGFGSDVRGWHKVGLWPIMY